jgi:hypothetical protein
MQELTRSQPCKTGLTATRPIPAVLSLALSAIHPAGGLAGQDPHASFLPHCFRRRAGFAFHAPCLAARGHLHTG